MLQGIGDDYVWMDWCHGGLFVIDALGTTVGWDHVEYPLVQCRSTSGGIDPLLETGSVGRPEEAEGVDETTDGHGTIIIRAPYSR